MTDLFDPVEHAILCDYFGVERPEALRRVDIYADHGASPRGARAVRVEPDARGRITAYTLANAVSRLLRPEMYRRLPRGTRITPSGMVSKRPRPGDNAELSPFCTPFRVLEINWANNGPYFSWPERYRADLVPGYGRYVITASGDSPELYGYDSIAIGFFAHGVGVRVGARQVILEWWQDYKHRGRAARWEGLIATGVFSPREALEMGATVWPPPPAPDPDDDWGDSWAWEDDAPEPGRVLQ